MLAIDPDMVISASGLWVHERCREFLDVLCRSHIECPEHRTAEYRLMHGIREVRLPASRRIMSLNDHLETLCHNIPGALIFRNPPIGIAGGQILIEL